MKPAFSYGQAGVDVDIEEAAAKILYEAAKESWSVRKGRLGEVITPFDDFSGIRTINVSQLSAGSLMNIGFDGVGTKVEFAERAGKYDTLAYDLIAMVCDDAVVRGAEPVLVGSILDVNTLGTDTSRLGFVEELAKGYVAAAKTANVAIINGEIAQLGNRLGSLDKFSLSWGAAVVWFAREERMFTGYKVKAGDAIVGLREKGLRSNGISLVRKILTHQHGDNWHQAEFGGGSLIEAALLPSRIYTPVLTDMFGGYSDEPKTEIHAVAHITGSGLPGKLGRALKPSGLGAKINDPFVPSDLMLYCQQKGGVSDTEAYRTWNMGQGMAIITPDPNSVIKVAGEHQVEAKLIGEVTAEKAIRITSRGYYAKETPVLEF